jgi:putative DNA primase/helicase
MSEFTLNTIQDYIDFYHSQGLNVIPCKKGKKEPAVAWKKYQSEKYTLPISEENNIAVVCGAISDNLFVIDLDSPELIQDFDFLKEQTLVVQTGSGSYHIYCKPTKGQKPSTMILSNEKSQTVIINSDGTYVIAPPSIHPDSGEPYQIISKTMNVGTIDLVTILHVLFKRGFEPTKGNKTLTDILKTANDAKDKYELALKNASYFIQRTDLDRLGAWQMLQHWNQMNTPPLSEKELETIFIAAGGDKKSPTDSQNNDSIVARYTKEIMKRYTFKTIRETKEILYYENGVYKYRGESIIAELCQKLIPNCTRYYVSEVTAAIERSTYVNLTDFDVDKGLLNCSNCFINIRDGRIIEHKPEILSKVQIPVTYNPKITPNEFIKFLYDCLDYKDVVSVLEHMASCLIRDAKFEKAFMYTGSGANGKSTFFYVLERVLGKDNTSHLSLHDIAVQRFSKAELSGKLANIYADISATELRDSASLKTIISGDRITVEKKNKDPFDIEVFAKLFFSANQIPEVYDDSDAFFRRWFIIEWKNKFYGKEADPNLRYKLTTEEEKSGILNVLIKIARLLEKRGHFRFTPSADSLRQTWRSRSNSIEAFGNDMLVFSSEPDYFEGKLELYDEYSKYCRENGLPLYRSRTFYDMFPKTFPVEEFIANSKRAWKGVKLKKRIEEEKRLERERKKSGGGLFD